MEFAEKANRIFWNTVLLYHRTDDVDFTPVCPFDDDTIEQKLFRKVWIDAVQWHLEDIIRRPDIDPAEALELKRRIDRSNQQRTDLVEEIDDYFLEKFSDVALEPGASINTESPAWAIDRLSILALKIYHMDAEVRRGDASAAHVEKCRAKLRVLLEQRTDLTEAIDTLLADLKAGRKRMKTYKQMKMYNDPSTNPELYAPKAKA